MISEDDLLRMLEEEPERLLAVLATCEDRVTLSLAAEMAGELGAQAVGPLIRLLEHPAPIVREGAVYGLAAAFVLLPPSAMAALREHVHREREPSPGVRSAVRDVLAPYESEED